MKIGLSAPIIGALLLAASISGEAVSAVVQGQPSEWPVVDAAKSGDVAALQEMIRQGADVNQVYGDGMTALHWAAERADVQVAKLLVAAGANVHAGTRIGRYIPLHLASRAGSAPVVQALLEAGSDVNATTTNSAATPLHLAARAGDPEAIRLLLDHGADVNAGESEWRHTPLFFAAGYNRAEAIKVLLERGADPEITARVIDVPHRAAVDQASERRMWELLSQFQQEAAEVSGGGERLTLSQLASGGVWRPTPSQLQVAIRAMRDVQLADRANEQEEQAVDRVDFFGDDGDGLSRRVNQGQASLVGMMGGMTPLLHAVRGGHVEATLALLDGGADINAVSAGDRSSPLLVAAINGHFDLALLLLGRGADPALASSPAGLTPLYAVLNVQWAPKTRYAQPTAAEQQRATHLEVMKALLDAGADPNVRLTAQQLWFSSKGTFDAPVLGASAFWRAAFALDVEVMRLLVAYGADPNIATKKPEAERRRQYRAAEDTTEIPDPTGLPPIPPGGPSAYPIHATSGLGYGERAAGNSHRYVPGGWLPAVRYVVEELGADVNARDDKGYTPLHNAAARGDHELIFYLLSKGADITALSRTGQTVADMANGPHQRAPPLPQTVALLEALGSRNNHKCMTC